jgi:hypothetical protein
MHVSKYRPRLDLSVDPPRVAVAPLDDPLACQLVSRLLHRLQACGYRRCTLELQEGSSMTAEAVAMLAEVETGGFEVAITTAHMARKPPSTATTEPVM